MRLRGSLKSLLAPKFIMILAVYGGRVPQPHLLSLFPFSACTHRLLPTHPPTFTEQPPWTWHNAKS